MGETGWTEVSFQPYGKERVDFGDVLVHFPDWDKGLGHIRTSNDIFVANLRITPLRTGAIPGDFAKGEVGVFMGKNPEGVTYTLTGAKVELCDRDKLVLDCTSADGVTSPVVMSLDEAEQEKRLAP